MDRKLPNEPSRRYTLDEDGYGEVVRKPEPMLRFSSPGLASKRSSFRARDRNSAYECKECSEAKEEARRRLLGRW